LFLFHYNDYTTKLMSYLLRRFLVALAEYEPNLAAHVVMLWQVGLAKRAMEGCVYAALVSTFSTGSIRIPEPGPGEDRHSLLHTTANRAVSHWKLTTCEDSGRPSVAKLVEFGRALGVRLQVIYTSFDETGIYRTRQPLAYWMDGCKSCIRCVDSPVVEPEPCMAIVLNPREDSRAKVQLGCHRKVHCGRACGTVRLFVAMSPMGYHSQLMHVDSPKHLGLESTFGIDTFAWPATGSTTTPALTSVPAMCSKELIETIWQNNALSSAMYIPVDKLLALWKSH